MIGCAWQFRVELSEQALRPVYEPAPPPGFPHDDPTPERIAAWWNDSLAADLATNTCRTGPALHDEQIRAYALLAAAHLGAPTARWAAVDIELWADHVLALADRFTGYIRNGREESPTP